MASTDTQWLLHSGERVVAMGSLVTVSLLWRHNHLFLKATSHHEVPGSNPAGAGFSLWLYRTVDSRYLKFQGTFWNTSRYPYFDISDLQNWVKIILTTTFNKYICNWTLEVRDIFIIFIYFFYTFNVKFKKNIVEKRSTIFHNIFYLLLDFMFYQVFTSR